jgi:hypothetical protein
MREKARGSAKSTIARTRQAPRARLSRHATNSPAGRALALQRLIGNQATGRLLRRTPEVTPSVESHINTLDGRGRALPDSVRNYFEPRFGQDFGDVRIHTDAASRESAQAVDAAAYTVGRNIVLGEGQYAPETTSGKRLLAHELTHVVQQSGTNGAALQRQPQPDMCIGMSPKEMSPREWRKCFNAGKITLNDADPVRFTFTGEKATPESVVKWMKRKDFTAEIVVRHIRNSHDFTGTTAALEALVNGFMAWVPIEKPSVCIRPVQIADDDGKNPTKLPSFDAAQRIWGKCCIDVTVKDAVTVKKTDFKTLDHSDANTGSPTAEEARLFAAAGSSGGCISVFIASTFQDGGVTSKDISGGAGSRYSGGDLVVVAVEGVDPTIVAHEMGHVMGYMRHDPAGTIMEVTASKHNQQESEKVAWVICEKVRKFAKSAGGKENCYFDGT